MTIEGRAMPTTVGILGRFGTCDQQPVTKATLKFGTDLSVVTTFFNGATSFGLGGSFVELTQGEVVVIAPADTVRITQGILRVRFDGVLCAREELVAVPAT